MSNIEIFSGLDYAYRVVDDAPPMRVLVETYKGESASGGEYITGRFYNGLSTPALSTVALRRACFVTTWEAHQADPAPAAPPLAPNRRYIALAAFCLGVASGCSIALLLAALLIPN